MTVYIAIDVPQRVTLVGGGKLRDFSVLLLLVGKDDDESSSNGLVFPKLSLLSTTRQAELITLCYL